MSDGIVAAYRIPAQLKLARVGEQPALVYKYISPATDGSVLPNARTLNRFRRLASATDEEILNFAKSFGVLNWSPESERTPSERESANKFDEILAGLASDDGERYDFTEQWRALALEFDAVIKIALDIRAGDNPRDELWKVWLGKVPVEAGENRSERGRNRRRKLLLDRLNERLEMTELRPMLVWESEDYRITFAGGNLRSALAALTIQALIGQRLRICAGCSEIFEPEGRRRYCDDCRRTDAPHRKAVRKYDSKNRKDAQSSV